MAIALVCVVELEAICDLGQERAGVFRQRMEEESVYNEAEGLDGGPNRVSELIFLSRSLSLSLACMLAAKSSRDSIARSPDVDNQMACDHVRVINGNNLRRAHQLRPTAPGRSINVPNQAPCCPGIKQSRGNGEEYEKKKKKKRVEL